MSRVDPDALVSALRKAGLTVKGYGNWKARDSSGGWNPRGIMNHHTASGAIASSQNRLLANGRAGLPGPLCHISIERDGTVRMIGWGNANHAGLGDPDVLRAVANESYATDPLVANQSTADGNVGFYGIEVQHVGTHGRYPLAQIEALVTTNAVICKLHGWSAKSCIHHREWTSRKIDMSWRGALRSRIQTLLDTPKGVEPLANVLLEKLYLTSPTARRHNQAANADDTRTREAPWTLLQWSWWQGWANAVTLGEIKALVSKPVQVEIDTDKIAAAVAAVLADDIADRVADRLAERLSA